MVSLGVLVQGRLKGVYVYRWRDKDYKMGGPFWELIEEADRHGGQAGHGIEDGVKGEKELERFGGAGLGDVGSGVGFEKFRGE